MLNIPGTEMIGTMKYTNIMKVNLIIYYNILGQAVIHTFKGEWEFKLKIIDGNLETPSMSYSLTSQSCEFDPPHDPTQSFLPTPPHPQQHQAPLPLIINNQLPTPQLPTSQPAPISLQSFSSSLPLASQFSQFNVDSPSPQISDYPLSAVATPSQLLWPRACPRPAPLTPPQSFPTIVNALNSIRAPNPNVIPGGARGVALQPAVNVVGSGSGTVNVGGTGFTGSFVAGNIGFGSGSGVGRGRRIHRYVESTGSGVFRTERGTTFSGGSIRTEGGSYIGLQHTHTRPESFVDAVYGRDGSVYSRDGRDNPVGACLQGPSGELMLNAETATPNLWPHSLSSLVIISPTLPSTQRLTSPPMTSTRDPSTMPSTRSPTRGTLPVAPKEVKKISASPQRSHQVIHRS